METSKGDRVDLKCFYFPPRWNLSPSGSPAWEMAARSSQAYKASFTASAIYLFFSLWDWIFFLCLLPFLTLQSLADSREEWKNFFYKPQTCCVQNCYQVFTHQKSTWAETKQREQLVRATISTHIFSSKGTIIKETQKTDSSRKQKPHTCLFVVCGSTDAPGFLP